MATGVVKVDVISASAKVRDYTVGNAKSDLEDEEMRTKVWTGVVPTYVRYGEPVPGKDNVLAEVPVYVTKWIEDNNKTGEAYSRGIASQPST